MKRSTLALSLVLALGLGVAQAAQDKGKVIATVNGQSITEQELEAYKVERAQAGPIQSREQLVDELIARELVHQDALAKKLDKDPQVQKELAQIRERVLMAAAVRKAVEKAPITDEELQAEYDKLKGRMQRNEMKARHILVDSKEKAAELIQQLDKGASFAELATQHSTGPTGKNGGDLGWFVPEQMVPPFAEAARALKKGSYTKEPVQTQFGWHVILLEDTRTVPAPGFAEVKEQLRAGVQQQRVAAYIEKLKSSAKIDIKKEKE